MPAAAPAGPSGARAALVGALAADVAGQLGPRGAGRSRGRARPIGGWAGFPRRGDAPHSGSRKPADDPMSTLVLTRGALALRKRVPALGSGTGELENLTGRGLLEHELLILDYDL